MAISQDLDKPKISVIIPFLRGRRGCETLKNTLSSLLLQKIISEIIVVSNTYDSTFVKELEDFSEVRLLVAPNIGVNAARNFGATMARGDLFFFLDDDCILPDEFFLNRLLALFLSHNNFLAIGGPYSSGKKSSWRCRGYNGLCNAWLELGAKPVTKALFESTNLLGGNLCIRRKAFGAGFHQDILSGGDEVELLRRLKKNGSIGFSPELEVYHAPDSSWKMLYSRAKKQGRARSKYSLHTPMPPARKTKEFISFLKKRPSTLFFSAFHFPIMAFFSFITPHNSPRE